MFMHSSYLNNKIIIKVILTNDMHYVCRYLQLLITLYESVVQPEWLSYLL
jgi:hypothetical protein